MLGNRSGKELGDREQSCPGGLRHVITELFNRSEMCVMIADALTCEIIWTNDALNRLIGSNAVGRKCYQILHGRETRCPQCDIAPLMERSGEVYVSREGYSEILGRSFRVYDSMVEWEPGRRVRVEYLVDFTEKAVNEEEYASVVDGLEDVDAPLDRLVQRQVHSRG